MVPNLQYDTRDSAIRPRKGLLADASLEISKGFRGTRDDFLKYRLDAGWFYTPFSRLTLAFAGRAGYIDPYGSNSELRDDQFFYLGGIANVRGFEENMLRRDTSDDPVGGRISISGTTEARIALTDTWEMALFYDTGRISDTISGQGDSGFRSTAGTGLRYITPIGPIGLMYGHKLDRKDGESSGVWHFSIGYTF
jgi:outer membrane protein insertion porin family